MLLAAACSTSITMGNVPLSLRISCHLRNTRICEQVHRHTVDSPMWNSLTNESFPPDYDLTVLPTYLRCFFVHVCATQDLSKISFVLELSKLRSNR